MEKDHINSKEEMPSYNTLENIPRCSECNLIYALKLNYKEGKPIINYACENNQ